MDLPPGRSPRPGDVGRIRPAHVHTPDNSSAVHDQFLAWGARRVRDPRQPVIVLDHDIQNESASNLAKYARIESFARDQGIAFFPKGRGIGHQVMVEEGFVLPGTFVAAADSHANLYGGVGALGTPFGRADAAALWATGTTWWEVPEVTLVHFEGALSPGATAKDVILTLLAAARRSVLGHAVEFRGPGVASLSIEGRLTIANMTTEWGAVAGIFPFDETLRAHHVQRVVRREGERGAPLAPGASAADAAWAERLAGDEGAEVAGRITLDLASVAPTVSGPNDVAAPHSLPELAARRIPIQKAYLLSCVNARQGDLAEAAAVLRGGRVAEGVELYVAAASAEVERDAVGSGVWKVLLDAGAIPLPAGCGPCIGLGRGVLRAGETGISATNRNFVGRMGDPSASCYLANPAVVAASALAGFIAAPGKAFASSTAHGPRVHVERFEPRSRGAPAGSAAGAEGAAVAAGAPGDGAPGEAAIEGELVLLSRDDLDTDGIWPSTLTYRDGVSPEEMARHVFRNYAPEFGEIARPGDLLAVGENFGTGSSREQAALAIRAFGIPLVIAASASSTFKRNAFNDGFPIVECAPLVSALRRRFAPEGKAAPRVVRTGLAARVDLGAGVVHVEGAAHAFTPLSPAARELLARGGLGPLVREALAAPHAAPGDASA